MNIRLHLLTLLFIVIKSIGSAQNIPPIIRDSSRIANIPKNAFWVGGIDGGNFYLVQKIDSINKTIHFKIYNDYTGDLIVDRVFKLYCDNLKINWSDIKNSINFFDGGKVGLTTTNQSNQYCYFE